ncbi:hypothetical protein BKA00_001954 [Actinomadura coerulea]|uniref:Uncharacterized protein n=1 Tax=Actinomadura coerulea TaxID=46159 RepID=A0A7X0KY53_9ACTN|nr:hypothetical protein [Actinomadura coerulea]MBB6395040.1 hypothetical protein [Actinomadura coerulea]GGQ14354.1 hypothetical protein GCM10010187_33290 [Actinomadura coerulea]
MKDDRAEGTHNPKPGRQTVDRSAAVLRRERGYSVNDEERPAGRREPPHRPAPPPVLTCACPDRRR